MELLPISTTGHWPQFNASCVPESGCGEDETLLLQVRLFFYRTAVSAAWLLGASVVFQVTHEAAPLWVRCVLLLLSCEASWL